MKKVGIIGKEIAELEVEYPEYFELKTENQKLKNEATKDYYRILMILLACICTLGTDLWHKVVIPIIELLV